MRIQPLEFRILLIAKMSPRYLAVVGGQGRIVVMNPGFRIKAVHKFTGVPVHLCTPGYRVTGIGYLLLGNWYRVL